jgi:hypothetical protein
MNKKKVQLQLSFGMIFSIFLIIAIIGIAIYVIIYFLNLGKCSEIGLMYQDLEKRVDKAWISEISREVFTGSVPSGVEGVCFGNLTQSFLGFEKEHNDIERGFRHSEDNLFLYPSGKACGKEGASHKLEHAETARFFCVNVVNGKFSVRIEKNNFDSFAKLEEVQ